MEHQEAFMEYPTRNSGTPAYLSWKAKKLEAFMEYQEAFMQYQEASMEYLEAFRMSLG